MLKCFEKMSLTFLNTSLMKIKFKLANIRKNSGRIRAEKNSERRTRMSRRRSGNASQAPAPPAKPTESGLVGFW
jgi:hypothetical protein